MSEKVSFGAVRYAMRRFHHHGDLNKALEEALEWLKKQRGATSWTEVASDLRNIADAAAAIVKELEKT